MTILLIFHMNEQTHRLRPAGGGWKRPIKGRHCRQRGGYGDVVRHGEAVGGCHGKGKQGLRPGAMFYVLRRGGKTMKTESGHPTAK